MQAFTKQIIKLIGEEDKELAALIHNEIIKQENSTGENYWELNHRNPYDV